MALVNGGFLHYTDMKKFLKNLVLRNRWSNFEIISQKAGFDISRQGFFYFTKKESDADYRRLPLSKFSPRKVFFPKQSIFPQEIHFPYVDTKYGDAI